MSSPGGSEIQNFSQPNGDIALDIGDHSTKHSSFKEVKRNGSSDDNRADETGHLSTSVKLGACSVPYCTICPTPSRSKEEKGGNLTISLQSNSKTSDILYGDDKHLGKKFFSFLSSYFPGVANPHAKFVQKWNKIFFSSCLLAIFVDPLFLFLLSIQKENKCIVINWTMTSTLVALRTITDSMYLLHILLQFRVAYINPETRQFGIGDLVDEPKKIALRYLSTFFYLDLFNVLPLPQIMILVVLPQFLGSSGANTAKNFLRAAILVQYIPRLIRVLPLLAGQSPTGFIFETAWANFVINLLTYVLAAHVVGSCWYLFGLQSVNQCLRIACRDSRIEKCTEFIDCGYGKEVDNGTTRMQWKESINASSCFTPDGFPYGIYQSAVNLSTKDSVIPRYVYAFFWGFQQISTLGGSEVPSYYVWEVLFAVAITGLGLLLFALLIGNMQNFLQALGKRRLDMSLRRLDCEEWMRNRRFPEELRWQIRAAERYNWVENRGIDEEMLLSNLPEDLQRDIRRHLYEFIKINNIFRRIDESMLDTIFERLKPKSYMKGRQILDHGSLVEKMVFIVHGEMESIGRSGKITLSKGDVCGEELLAYCLEYPSQNKGAKKSRFTGLKSNRRVLCLNNVKAYTLGAEDIEEIIARFSHSPGVQGAVRHDATDLPGIRRRRIQVVRRYRKHRLGRTEATN